MEAPPAPAVARTVFGPSLGKVETYAALLSGSGVTRGLLGPREVPRLWERHLLNCAVLAPALEGGSVCDVGSGAGLPGVLLALLRPDVEVTLLEPLLRRTSFLSEVIEELELPNSRVVRQRAEEHDGVYEVVVARAVAPLGKLAALTLPLCVEGGTVLAMKGERAPDELAAAEGELRASGAVDWQLEKYGEDILDAPTTVVRIVAGSGVGEARPVKVRTDDEGRSKQSRGRANE